MAGHSLPTERREPVAVAAAVHAVLAALVTLGWLNLDEPGVAALGTVAAALVAALVTRSARAATTPVAPPTAAEAVPATEILAREAPPPATPHSADTSS